MPDSKTGVHERDDIQAESTGRVLGTPELLEAILLRLPTQDLLLSQRVNKQFKDTITQSMRLQQALFLAPAPVSVSGTEAIINPLLVLSKLRRIRFTRDGQDAQIRYFRHFGPNPFVREAAIRDQPSSIFLQLTPDRVKNMSEQMEIYRSGSYERMFLNQPPCNVRVCVSKKAYGDMVMVMGVVPLGEVIEEALNYPTHGPWCEVRSFERE